MNSSSSLTLHPLTHLGLLKLEGPDNRKFLQGQITSDALAIDNHHLLHAAHCTPKGRMLANFDCFASSEGVLYMRLYADALAILRQSLSKYIVFSKAELSDISGNYRAFGLTGSNAVSAANELLHCELSEDDAAAKFDDGFMLRIDAQRVEIWIHNDNSQTLSQLQTIATLTDAPTIWVKADIEAGKGWVSEATSEDFLPQALNLDSPEIDGINFKKGCYTGQEIVARMHYKGKSKRHMYRLTTSANSEAKAGDNIFNADGKAVGQVVNLVNLEDGCELLGSVNDLDAEESTLFLGEDKKLELAVSKMSYTATI